MTHAAPVPPPVLDFFARYHANPDVAALCVLRIDLLDLEVNRARHNLPARRPLVQASLDHRLALDQAERALGIARRLVFTDHRLAG